MNFSENSLIDLLGVGYLEKETMEKTNDLGFVLENCYEEKYKKYSIEGEVVGECVILNVDKKELNKIGDKLGLIVLDRYEVEGKQIIEGFSAKLPYKIKDRRANVQIAIEEEQIVVATPIIYGSY